MARKRTVNTKPLNRSPMGRNRSIDPKPLIHIKVARKEIVASKPSSRLRQLDRKHAHAQTHGPGHWTEPDTIERAGGLSEEQVDQYRVAYNWAILMEKMLREELNTDVRTHLIGSYNWHRCKALYDARHVPKIKRWRAFSDKYTRAKNVLNALYNESALQGQLPLSQEHGNRVSNEDSRIEQEEMEIDEVEDDYTAARETLPEEAEHPVGNTIYADVGSNASENDVFQDQDFEDVYEPNIYYAPELAGTIPNHEFLSEDPRQFWPPQVQQVDNVFDFAVLEEDWF